MIIGAIYITQEMVYIDVLDYTGWLFERIAHQGPGICYFLHTMLGNGTV